LDGDGAAKRDADQRDGPHIEGIQDGGHHPGVTGNRVGAVGQFALAVAHEVRRDDPVVVGEGVDDRRPRDGRGVDDTAVEQDDGVAVPALAVVNPTVGGRDVHTDSQCRSD
jgi:hypothetical protein